MPFPPSSPPPTSPGAPVGPGPGGLGSPTDKPTLVRRELARRLRIRASEGAGGTDPYAALSDDDLVDRVVKKYPDSLYGDILAKSMVPDLPGGGAAPGAIPPPTMSTADSLLAMAGNAIASPVTGARRIAKGAVEYGNVLHQQGITPAVGDLPSPTPPPPRVQQVGPETPLSAQEAAQPLADIFGGGMEAGELALIPAMIAAPWATAGALALGTAATEVVGRGARALGAPPAIEELLGGAAGLAAGGAAAHTIEGVRAGGRMARAEGRIPAADEAAAAAGDQQFEHNLAERTMRGELTAEASLLEADQAKAQAALEDLHAKLALNVGLQALAEEYRTNGMGSKSPWDYLSKVQQVAEAPPPPLQLGVGTPPPEPKLLGPAEGPPVAPLNDQVIAAGPSTDPFVANPGFSGPTPPPPNLDYTGVPVEQRVATAGPEGYPRVAQLADAFEQNLAAAPEGPPRLVPNERSKAKLRDQQIYKDTLAATVRGMADEMEAVDSQKGKRVEDVKTGESYFVPPSGLADVYHQITKRIVGDDTAKHGPGGKIIKAVLRTYADSDGRLAAKDLNAGQVTKGMDLANVEVRKFRNAYDRWAPEIKRIADQRARRRLAQEHPEIHSSMLDRELGLSQTAAESLPPGTREGAPPEFPGEASTVPPTPEAQLGPPPSAAEEPLPYFLENLEADPTAEGGYESGELQAGGEAGQPPRAPFFERLKGEEGVLRLTVPAGDEAGLRRWLRKQESEYGAEPWFEEAQRALEEGDHRSAWRIAAIASAKSFAGAGGAVAEKVKEGAPSPSDLVSQTKAGYKKQIETELGHPLPESVAVSPEGLLTFDMGGKGVPALKARATDLTLARTFLGDLTEASDPTQIIKIEGNKDPNLRVNAQIADQIVREMDSKVLEDVMELTGITDPIEIGRQYRRAFSQAGRNLNILSRYVQDNGDLFYDYGPVNETGAAAEVGSVGALQALGVKTPEGFVQWLGGKPVTVETVKAAGFELPKGIPFKDAKGNLTPQAKTYARNWFRRQTRLAEAQASIDLLAKEGSFLDRAMARANIQGQGGEQPPNRLQQIVSLSKAFLIAKPSTMLKNLQSQGIRYGFGMMDDVITGTLAKMTGNEEAARLHLTEVKNLARVPTGATSSASLIKHPWADGMQAIYDYTDASVSGMKPRDVRRFLNALEDNPAQEARFLGTGTLQEASAGTEGGKLRAVANTVTVFNRIQEHFFRATVGDAIFRSQLELAGHDPNLLLADPKRLHETLGADQLESMLGTAVSAALDATFAGDPIPGTAPAILVDFFSKNPVTGPLLQLGFPFPRFNFASAPRWLWDHFPLAPLLDVPVAYARAWMGDTQNLGRGRYSFMRQYERSTRDLLALSNELGAEEYKAAKALGEFMGAKEDVRRATAGGKAVDARAGQGGQLPQVDEAVSAVSADLAGRAAAANEAKATWREAEARIKNLRAQREKTTKVNRELREAGVARNPHEYFAQKMTGAALFTAAYLLRASDGANGTKWYEYKVEDRDPENPTDVKQVTLDLRSDAPFVQSAFLADIVHDVQASTDWSKLTPEIAAGGPDAWSQFMREHYTGKYTMGEGFKDAMEAYLSISPAAGSTRDILSMFTGRAAQGEEMDLGTVQRAVIGSVGEFLGRFTSPLSAISDVTAGLGDEESGLARIPATGGKEKKSVGRQLVDPALANIPGANRLILPKVSALTGEPIKSVKPGLRQLLGTTFREESVVEAEINRIGLPYGAAVPRQTGDREFDNQVNQAYAEILDEYFPQILENEQYQSLTPELQRDVLANGMPGTPAIFPQLKRAAYAKVAETLGGEDVSGRLEGGAVTEKKARWQRYLDQLDREAAEAVGPVAEEPAAAPSEPEPGAPPALPF